jgi:uncharacterized membrane protein YgdD (TMEM256/DUF423 family)
MCAAVIVMVCYGVGVLEGNGMCAAVSVMVCYIVGRGSKMFMYAAVSFMVCYMEVEREGNSNVCCS